MLNKAQDVLVQMNFSPLERKRECRSRYGRGLMRTWASLKVQFTEGFVYHHMYSTMNIYNTNKITEPKSVRVIAPPNAITK